MSWEQRCQCPGKTLAPSISLLPGERYPGANSYRQQRGNHALAETRQCFPSLAVLGDPGQGTKPACDSSVQSTGSFADSYQHIFLFSSTLSRPLPRDPRDLISLPSFGEEPGLPAQRPWGKEKGDRQCEHPLSVPQDN